MGWLCSWSMASLTWSGMQNLKSSGQITPGSSRFSHISIFLFCVVGMSQGSVGGLTSSRIWNLKFSCQITSRSEPVSLYFLYFTHFARLSVFLVKGWSHVVKNAKFEILGSNYLSSSWSPHNLIISFWSFCVSLVCSRSTGGLTRSRMQNFNCTGQIILRSQLVAP